MIFHRVHRIERMRVLMLSDHRPVAGSDVEGVEHDDGTTAWRAGKGRQ
jgi:hypothetical protein